MHWVYIVSLADKKYYIGETTHLYRRLTEHNNEKGANYTREYGCRYLFAIYAVHMDAIYKWLSDSIIGKECVLDTLSTLVEMHKRNSKSGVICYKNYACDLENDVTVCMSKRHTFDRVRGGKWCKDEYEKDPTVLYGSVRPHCLCANRLYPAEVYYDYQFDILYFACPKRQMGWIEHDEIYVPYVDTPCNFRLNVDENNNYYNHGWKVKETIL